MRLFLNPSDSPNIYFDSKLGSVYVANQSGRYVKKDKPEINARYRINNSGWNSPHDYTEDKQKDVYRIAVVGDSMVESLQVDYDKSYSYLLENALNNINPLKKKIEVYTFGHSGANLNHYFHIGEFVTQKYKPDLLIVTITANDFKESLYGASRKDNWSLKFANDNFIDIPPQPSNNLLLKKIIRKSALVRYLTINLNLVNTSPIFNKLFYAGTKQNTTDMDSTNLIQNDQFLESMVENILTRLSQNNNKSGTKALLVLDSDRSALYKGEDISLAASHRFNSVVEKSAKKLKLSLIRLSPVFEKDWEENKKRFDWEGDEHWNEYGHNIVRKAIEEWLQKTYNQT